MPPRPRPTLVAGALAILLAACQGDSDALGHGLSTASAQPPSSVLRFPIGGGPAQLYDLPDLKPAEWRTVDPVPPLRRVLGADLDLGLVYLLGAKNELLAIDLQSTRGRVQLATGIREATMGPEGTVYAVDDSLNVVEFVRRNPIRFPTRVPARPRDLFGTKDRDLLALSTAGGNALTLLKTDQPASKRTLPQGDATATLWGDLMAVAADTAVLLVEPQGMDVSIPVPGHARAVLFSPSGHRFYVARREGGILVFNRFTHEKLGEVDLPGPAGSLRADPYGRWLLVHPPTADSLWLVDLATGRFIGGFATEWSSGLPAVTNRGLLLLQEGSDLTARDPSNPKFPVVGRVPGGAHDLWLPLAWNPAAPTEDIPIDTSTEVAADSTGGPPQVYLQVSSSQNRSWSAELARQLADAGLPAKVLDPRPGEEGYRVVLGPYPSREAAEAAGKTLGRPFFIYQPNR